jgi:hypothetical protein
MAAVDDLTELVERAAAAEKSALASKWKEQSDVQALIRRTRTAGEEQRQAVRLDSDPDRLSPRWGALRQKYLDLGAQLALPVRSIRPRWAPRTAARPSTSSSSEAASRKPGSNGTVSASRATPPAVSASAVRIHAKNVRSLASVNRGSGSLPSPHTQRGKRAARIAGPTSLGPQRTST